MQAIADQLDALKDRTPLLLFEEPPEPLEPPEPPDVPVDAGTAVVETTPAKDEGGQYVRVGL